MPGNTSPRKIQDQRQEVVEALLHSRPQLSIQAVMLSADAILTFVQSGEILGVPPREENKTDPAPRRRLRTGVQH